MPDQEPRREAQDDWIEVMIQVSRDYALPEIADQLRVAGIEVERELKRAHLLTARMPRALVAEVERHPGVCLVRMSGTYQLPPFREEVPQ